MHSSPESTSESELPRGNYRGFPRWSQWEQEKALSLLSTDAERMVRNHRVSLAQNHQEHGF